MGPMQALIVIICFFLLIILFSAIRILREYERAVVFRLGRLIGSKGPGLVLLIPIVDRMVRISLRTIVFDVPAQDVITKDNVSLQVNAVVYFRVFYPEKAVVEVENYEHATSQLSQTALRSILGQSMLDEVLAEREKLNSELQRIIDAQASQWGIKVSNVEIKHVDLPIEMKRAMAKQAEAERERRAKVIHADGEFQASQKLFEAATIMSSNPVAIQLRFLQTLTEIATEKNSTTIFPVPIDLISPFIQNNKDHEKELIK